MSFKDQQIMFESFAVKWKLNKDQVFYIYNLIEQTGGKYGKSSRILRGFGFKMSPRQLKYFFRKSKLHNRLDISHRGKPDNYSKLLRKL